MSSPSFENTDPTDLVGAGQENRPSLTQADKDFTITHLGPVGPTSLRGPHKGPADRYLLGAEIARGGMGIVYAARDEALDRCVAVKVLHAKFLDNPQVPQRFVEEAHIAGRLQHPGIAPVHDLGTLPDGRLFLAMKLIEGRTLAQLLKDRPGPEADLPRLLQIFEQVAQTVAYAHSKHVIHRDLKPSNIMVGAFGEVQVMDWGLAKVLTREQPPSTDHGETPAAPPESIIESFRDPDAQTLAGSILGTPAYMPPEQARGDIQRVDRRADVFALGAILCELLTGQPPYTGNSEEVRLQAQRGQTAPACQRLDGCQADPELLALGKRCLSAALEDRPADASEVARAVAEHRAGVEERLRKAEVQRAANQVKAIERRKRRRVQALLAASLVVVVALIVGGSLWNDRRTTLQQIEQDRIKAEAKAEQARIQAIQDAQLRQGVELAFQQTEGALREDKSELAEAALTQAAAQLKDGGPADLQERLAQWQGDLAMVRQLERIRERRWAARYDVSTDLTTVVPYLSAFLSYRLWKQSDDPALLAESIRRSPIRGQLLSGLYSWLIVEGNWVTRQFLVAVLKQIDPDPTRDKIRSAMASRNGDQLNETIKSLKGNELPSQLVVGLADFDSLDHAQRLRLLREALASNPNDFLVAVTLGQLYEQPGRANYAEAVGFYRTALASRPTNPNAFMLLGRALARQGNLDESAAVFHQALRIRPHDLWIHASFALTFRAKGDHEGAIRELREALKLDPDERYIQLALAQQLVQAQRFCEALKLFTKAYAAQLSRTDASAYAARNQVIACAARAGTGQGLDAPPPDERASLRQQALDHLQTLLADLNKRLADDPVKNRIFVHNQLQQWLRSGPLTAVRQPANILMFPVNEREAWTKFWADVRALSDQTAP